MSATAAETRPFARGSARWRLAAVLAITAFAVFTFVLASGFRRDPRDIRTGTVGRPAPAIDLPRLDGSGRFSLASELAQGKAVVVYFFASWCVPCKEEYPVLVRVWERCRKTDVVIVGILFQDSPEAGLEFHRRLGGTWPTVHDESSRVAIAFGVFGIPETYFIRPNGVIAGRHIGIMGEGTLIRGIDAIRPKAPVP